MGRVGLAVFPIIDLAVPPVRLARVHRQEDMRAEQRAAAFGRIRVVIIDSAGIPFPGNDAPQYAVAIVDPDMGFAVGDKPFPGRIGRQGHA